MCSPGPQHPFPTRTPGETTLRSTFRSSSWDGSGAMPAGAARWARRARGLPVADHFSLNRGLWMAFAVSAVYASIRWRSTGADEPSRCWWSRHRGWHHVRAVAAVRHAGAPGRDSREQQPPRRHRRDRHLHRGEGSPLVGFGTTARCRAASARSPAARPRPAISAPRRPLALRDSCGDYPDNGFRWHRLVPVLLCHAVPPPGPGAVVSRRGDLHGAAGRRALLLRLRLARLGDVHDPHRHRTHGPVRPARSRGGSVDPVTDGSASYAAEVARLLWSTPGRRPTSPAAAALTDPIATPTCSRAAAPPAPATRRPARFLEHDPTARGRAVSARRPRDLAARAVGTFARLHPGEVAHAASPARRPGRRLDREIPRRVLRDRVRVGILLGTRRVNQKPVLQVFDLQGRVAGYAKVGHNTLTAAFAKREASPSQTSARSRPVPSRSPRCSITAGGRALRCSSCHTSRPRRASRSPRPYASRRCMRWHSSATPWFARGRERVLGRAAARRRTSR